MRKGIEGDTCTPAFTAASLTITKLWMQPKRERVNKVWYFHSVNMTQLAMNLGDTVLSNNSHSGILFDSTCILIYRDRKPVGGGGSTHL